MSGIVGIHYFDGRSVERTDLKEMVDVLAHRGPDGSDIWSEGSVGVGHCMLWTTPESLVEKLPLVSQTGDLVITADARIDNRDELLPALGLDNGIPEKITDSQLILAAYQQWGEQCPEQLLGDFAFAIWDKSKQTFFCARDHLGVKPFYYYSSHQAFVFASEMKALLSVSEISPRLNEVRMGDYLTMMMEDQSITIYKSILRLPPAHSMSVSQSGVQLWAYWCLDPERELQLDSDEAYAKAFREIFTKAVRCRLRSALPVGSQLSGGLDSSSVTCIARKLLAQAGNTPLHTVSNIFEDLPECDEQPFINTVLAQGEMIPHYVHADQLSPLSELDQIWQYEDEALIAPNHFLSWGLNRAAQQAGIRVFLDGFDGDTAVSHGGVRFAELARQQEWESFAREAKAISAHFPISPQMLLNSYGVVPLQGLAKQARWVAFAKAVHQLHKHLDISRRHLLIKHGLKALVPKRMRQIRRRLRRGRSGKPTSPVSPLVNPSFAQRISLAERINMLGRHSEQPTTARADHWQALTTGLIAFALEQLDQYAAAFSLEARHPFMDKRLIEFCLALPSEQKLYQGWSRMVLRRALADVLPETIQWRGGKTTMTPNFQRGLLKFDHELLDQVVFQRSQQMEKYVDLHFLRKTYQQVQSGEKLHDPDIMVLWRAITIALWLNRNQVTS